MKKPDGPRDPVAGPAEGPPAPYPIKLRGPVIKGFGRGSRELGIPTANIPPSGLDAYPDLESGVYFGYVGLLPLGTASPSTYPAVLSIGYNPFYKNKTRSVEIHILHKFHTDFYSASLNLMILGFVRPEYDYNSLESLIDDIMFDCDVARKSLSRPAYVKFEGDRWLTEFGWKETTNVEEIEKEVLGQKRAVE